MAARSGQSIENRRDIDCTLLEVGDGASGDAVRYPSDDIDMDKAGLPARLSARRWLSMVGQQNRDISAAQGTLITAEAATWSGTKYVSIGEASSKGVGGDCSGSTFRIYAAAGFPYDYRRTEDFPAYALKSGHFRELAAGDKPQDGDVLSWHGHMSIYSTFSTASEAASATTKDRRGAAQFNDMWTAFHPGGPVYGPAKASYFRPDPPHIFRYQRPG